VVKLTIGVVLAFLVGAGCRWFDLPAPSPPTLLGACLVVSVTLGYVTVDQWIKSRAANAPVASEQVGPR
jgi:XapX domain-containing protein